MSNYRPIIRRALASATAAVIETLETRVMLTSVAFTGTSSAENFSISIDNATNKYVFSGGSSVPSPVNVADFTGFSLNGGGGSDSLTINAGNVTMLNDGGSAISVTVAAGAVLNFAGTEHLASLTIGADARVSMSPNRRSLVTTTLSMNSTAKLDLVDGSLITTSSIGSWNGTAYTGISGLVQSGLNEGQWDGAGIRKFMGQETFTLGVATASEALGLGSGETGLWCGETVGATAVLVRYTYFGDANIDGLLNADDYANIDLYSQVPGANTWNHGDFNYDGAINADDYALLDLNSNSFSRLAPDTATAGSAYSITLPPTTALTAAAEMWMVNWGDGFVERFDSPGSSVSHVYSGAFSNRTVNVSAIAYGSPELSGSTYTTAIVGAFPGEDVEVNAPSSTPATAIGGNLTIAENVPGGNQSAYTLSLPSLTTANQTITGWTIVWGDSSSNTTLGTAPPTTTHTFASGVTTATVTATATRSGGSATSQNLVVDIIPAQPTDLVATPVSANQIELSWQDNSSIETGQTLDRATNPTFTSGLVSSSLSANVTSNTVTGLSAATIYYFRIRATDSTGKSPYQGTIGASLAPAVVPNLTGLDDTSGQIAPGADGGNPAEMGYSGSVRFFDGTVTVESSDLASSEPSLISGHSRTWTSERGLVNDPLNGNDMVVSQWPILLPGASSSIRVVTGGRVSRQFDPSGGGYAERYYGQDNLASDGTGGFVLTDSGGNRFHFFGYSSSLPSVERGRLQTLTDPGGNVTSFTYGTSGLLNQIIRSRQSDGAALERLNYQYNAADQLARVDMSRRDATNGTMSAVRSAIFTYYNAASSFGRTGDLAQVTVTQGGVEVEHKLYRYDTASGLLTYVVEGDSYERLAAAGNPLTLANATVAQYADQAFTYFGAADGAKNGKVKTQKLKGGTYTYTYDYLAESAATDLNIWRYKTLETLPDANTNTVYTNIAGEVLLKVFTDVNDAGNSSLEGKQWATGYKYDSKGRLTLAAEPSSLTTTAASGRPTFLTDSSTVWYLNDSGLEEVTAYYSSTAASTSSVGGVAGYLQTTARRRGFDADNNIPTSSQSYILRTGSDGTTIAPVAASTVYRDEEASVAVTTTIVYTWQGTTVQARSEVDTLPVIDADQNGSGTASTATTFFDAFGRSTWVVDEDGYISYTAYDDATGAVVQSIEDVNYSELSTAEQGSFASTSLSQPSGLGLRTSYLPDLLGRTTEMTDPLGRLTTTSYRDDAEVKAVTITPPATSGGSTPPPAVITRDDRKLGVLDIFEVAQSIGGGLTSTITKRTQSIFSIAQELSATERYEGTGSLSYSTSTGQISGSGSRYRTEFGYDDRGRQDVVTAGRELFTSSMSSTSPTVTQTIYDSPGRPTKTLIGTNPSVSGNMTLVGQNQYDGDGVGDGNLTRVTEFPGDGSPNRVTQNSYDWRDRLVAAKAGVETSESSDVNRPIIYRGYDNLDRVVGLYVYDGDGATVSTSDGVPNQPDVSRLRAFTMTQFDDRGRVYRTSAFSINQSSPSDPTGGLVVDQYANFSWTDIAAASGLRTDVWYDGRGNHIKSLAPGGLVTKAQFDGAGRMVKQYTTDGGGDPAPGASGAYASAGTVTGDIVLEQVATQYDDNDNALLVTTKQRWHDAEGTGDLQPGNAAILTKANPNARVSFIANWYDEANRLTTSVNYGNNGNSGDSNNDGVVDFSRPSSPPSRSSVDGWDPYLVNSMAYNPQGLVEFVTDPRGIQTQTIFDALGRQSVMFESYESGEVIGVDTNRKTIWTHNGYDQIKTQSNTTYDGGSGPRTYTTSYTYGVAKDSTNFENNSGQLKSITYGAVTGAPSGYTDIETFSGYNALGEVIRKTERNATIHQYSISVLGQMTVDAWTNYSPSPYPNLMSTWATKKEYAFDALGRGTLFTMKDSSGSVLNQVQRAYDGLGNLITEWQEHSGSVSTGSSPKVGYVYDTNYTSNYTRLQQLTYPNGRTLSYVYGYNPRYNSDTNSVQTDLNNRISRVGYIADGATPTSGSILEANDYLGLNRVVIRDYPNATGSLGLSYWDGGNFQASGDKDDAGNKDPYGGLDRFGRITEQNWGPEDRTFAYDADGNVLYERIFSNNVQERWKSSLYHADGATAATAYDNLNRMTEFSRGKLTLSSGTYNSVDQSDTSVPTEYLNQTWGVSGTGTDANFDRTDANADPGRKVYQKLVPLTAFVPSPTPSDPRRDIFVQFDAWGELRTQADSTLSTYGQSGSNWAYQRAYAKNYEYDALGRRIKESYTNDNQTIQLYYDSNGNVIEDRRQIGTNTPTTENQYVFSAADPRMMVLRDRDDDQNTSTGNLGKTGSGLDLRVWVMQGPDGSTWRIREQGGGSIAYEQFLYTPEGKATLIRRNSLASGDYEVNLPNSAYSWRYLWRGGRASIDHAPADSNDLSNSSGIELYDGLVYFAGAGEHDTLAGSPVSEDVYAYQITSQPYNSRSTENTQLQGNGTTDAYAHASTNWTDYFWGDVGNTLSGMASGLWRSVTNPLETVDRVVDATGNFIAAGVVDREDSGQSGLYIGLMAWLEGASYIVSSAVGARQIIEGSSSYDLTTSEVLRTNERIARGFGGLSMMAFSGAGLAGAYLSPVNQLQTQVFEMQGFCLEGYGSIRARAIAGTYGIGRGVSNPEIGLAGEFAAGRYLIGQGVRDLAQIKNASGQGIDLTGRAGPLRMFSEVKASRGQVAPSLSAAQRNITTFVRSRIGWASGSARNPWWRNVNPGVRLLAEQVRREIGTGPITGQVIDVTNMAGWRPVISPRGW